MQEVSGKLREYVSRCDQLSARKMPCKSLSKLDPTIAKTASILNGENLQASARMNYQFLSAPNKLSAKRRVVPEKRGMALPQAPSAHSRAAAAEQIANQILMAS